MGLKRVGNMTEATALGEQYSDLHYVYQRYLYPDALRGAITAIVNGTFRIRQPHIWGEGTTACASDSQQLIRENFCQLPPSRKCKSSRVLSIAPEAQMRLSVVDYRQEVCRLGSKSSDRVAYPLSRQRGNGLLAC